MMVNSHSSRQSQFQDPTELCSRDRALSLDKVACNSGTLHDTLHNSIFSLHQSPLRLEAAVRGNRNYVVVTCCLPDYTLVLMERMTV